MIISRYYVTFRHLLSSGDKGGAFFIEKLHESYPEEMWDQMWNSLADLCLYQREMSWAFSKLGDVLEMFDKLDAESPYDNGCTYEDINDFDIEWKEENYIKFHLISNRYGEKIIVKVVEYTE